MNARLVCLLLSGLTVWAGAGCRPTPAASAAESAELSARVQRLTTNLSNAGSARTSALAKWILPRDMREVSGLALTSDGRLLAHGDEQGRVYVIDPRGGALLKRFSIGNTVADASADFEGITVANGRILMVASNGMLYEFAEGEDGERIGFTVHDTRLGHECEFEGVAFDSTQGIVVLPCKTVGTRNLRDHLVLYRWRLGGSGDSTLAPITIPLNKVIGSNRWKGLHPSDITVDPATGHYVLVAAQEKALIEITPSGEVVRAVPLPGKHGQPEGIALTADGILIVGDEARSRPATLTLYRWPLTAGTPKP
jgi:uncharacterized protein YjiK